MASLEEKTNEIIIEDGSKTYEIKNCLLYTSPSPRD